MAVYTYDGQKYTIDDSVPQDEAIKKIKAHVGKSAGTALPKEKERTTIGEDMAQGFAGVGNLADTFGTMAGAGVRTLLGQNKDGALDPMFTSLADRKKSRLDWAGGQGKEKGVSGAVISAVTGLPGLPLAPVSGLERATDLMDKGVPLSQAGPAGAIDSALSTGAAMLPILGKTLPTKALAGAIGNVTTGGASDVATQALVKDKKVAKDYNPLDVERRMSEAILGAAGGAMTGRVKPKVVNEVPKPTQAAMDKLDALLKPADFDTPYRKSMAEKIADNQTVAALESALAPEIVVDSKGQAVRAADFDNPYFERDRSKYDPAPKPVETIAQNELFDQPEQGRVANPYEAVTGDWRVDENGMPVKADLSMDVLGAENPLQRGLWGDELLSKHPQEDLPLTQAMDSMQPHEMRNAVEDQNMTQDLPQSPELAAALMEQTTQTPGSANPSMYIPQSQRGAIDLGNASEKSNEKKRIAKLAINSPEVREASEQLRTGLKRDFLNTSLGLQGYRNVIDTPEKVIAASLSAKDITKAQYLRGVSVTPGINAVAIATANPLVSFVRDKTRKVFQESERLAERYITNKDTGIGSVLNSMNQAEKNQMIAILQKGDKAQQFVSRSIMEQAGVPNKVITAVEKFYEMDVKKLEIWNEARAKVGLDPVKERAGHFPGVFKGDYKQIVTKDDKVIGVISVDTKVQLKKAQQKLEQDFPGAKFSTVHRSALGGNGRKSDMFSGMNDVLTLLAKDDPEFAKVQELIKTAVKENADALYGASLHSMAKKGVIGNAGNKPWLDVDTNTNEAIKAYLQYWEEGITSHKNLAAETEIRGLLDNPALEQMPNAKNYVNDYIKNMTGRDLGTVGDALNKLLDAPFKAIGVGPSVPREIVNQLNKRLGQHTMGYFNWMFAAVQYLQIPQMGLPEMNALKKASGVSEFDLPKALLDLQMEVYGGKGSPLIKEAFLEAEKRGMGVFSEYQDVNKVTQNKYSRAYDNVVDINRSLPEKQTRPWMFMTFAKMLENSGLPKNEIFDIAENATQSAMIDYSPRERPMMYQRLGVVGQLAGSLQTFKHAQLGQIARFLGRGDVGAATASMAVMLAFAGIKGVPGYQELDGMYKYITDKFFGDKRSIADTVLKNLPEWLKSGAISAATDVNVQGRLSSANVVPDTVAEAVMPLSGALGNMAEASWNLATKQDGLSAREFAKAMSPSGPIKGMVDSTVNVNADGIPVDKQGLPSNPRSEWDTMVKRSGAGSSLTETLRNEKQWSQQEREMAHREAQKNIMLELAREIRQDTLTEEKKDRMLSKYLMRNGDPSRFIQAIIDYSKEKTQTKQERLQGIPNGSLPSIYKYQNYQEQ